MTRWEESPLEWAGLLPALSKSVLRLFSKLWICSHGNRGKGYMSVHVCTYSCDDVIGCGS